MLGRAFPTVAALVRRQSAAASLRMAHGRLVCSGSALTPQLLSCSGTSGVVKASSSGSGAASRSISTAVAGAARRGKGFAHRMSAVDALIYRPAGEAVRRLNIHEYQSMDLLKKFQVPTSTGNVAKTPEEAANIVKQMQPKVKDFVVKAQVLTGGRGKGFFTNGFQGGVHYCRSASEAQAIAKQMLGHRLITKQTGAEGKPCDKVLITERLFIRQEAYFAILMDRASEGPVMVASPKGGMDIEKVAAETPEHIYKEPIDITKGPQPQQLERLAKAMGFDSEATLAAATSTMGKLYDLFIKCDNTLVEINPLAETHDGRIVCLDVKLNFDPNAEFRQKEIFHLADHTQMDQREVVAEKAGLSYIGLDGNIGCLVNGAGLAMATMDAIKLHGGNPANFLDLGGGASEKQVIEAFKLLNGDKHVKAILVNIFGGIMRCDIIALGLIRAATEIGLKKPLVVRLAGTNVNEAKDLIEESGMRMISTDDLNDAAQKVVRVTEIVEMAESARIHVSFELPL